MFRDLDLGPFGPKNNEFPGFVVEHFCVKFVDRSCISF